MKICFAFLAACLILCCCSARKPRRPAVVGLEKIERRVIEASGIGLPGKEMKTARDMRRSSCANARNMAEQQLETIALGLQTVEGKVLSGVLSVEPRRAEQLRKLIKKTKPVRLEWTSDNGCAVTLQLPKKLIEKKLSLRIR